MRESYPFTTSLTVQYADLDGQAIVFYGNYLTYVDIAINSFIRESGVDYPHWTQESGLDFNVVKADIVYHAPLLEDDSIELGVRLERMGRSSVSWQVALFRSDETDPAAEAAVIWVCADQTAHTSHPIPDELRVPFLALSEHDT